MNRNYIYQSVTKLKMHFIKKPFQIISQILKSLNIIEKGTESKKFLLKLMFRPCIPKAIIRNLTFQRPSSHSDNGLWNVGSECRF